MKALISDNFQEKDLNKFDIIFTYFPSTKFHKNVHYLFNHYQNCQVKEIIKFRKIFYGDLFVANDTSNVYIKEAFDINFIENIYREYNALNEVIDKYEIKEIHLNSEKFNQNIFRIVSKSKNLKYFSSSLKNTFFTISKLILIFPSIFIIIYHIFKTHFQNRLLSKFKSEEKDKNSKITVIASGRNSDLRLIEKLKDLKNIHWYITTNSYTKTLKKFIESIQKRNESFFIQKSSIWMSITIFFRSIVNIFSIISFSFKKIKVNGVFSNYTLFDFIDIYGYLYFLTAVNYLKVSSNIIYKKDLNNFSKRNIFMTAPGTSYIELNKLLIANGFETNHFQHGMMIEPFSYKFNVTKNFLFSELDVKIMNMMCDDDVINEYPISQINNFSSATSKNFKDILSIGVLSTTLHYSSNKILNYSLKKHDQSHQEYFLKMIESLKDKNPKFHINFKFHPNQEHHEIGNFIDQYTESLDEIISKSHIIITPVSSTVLNLILNKVPFILYNPKIYLEDSFSSLVDKDLIVSNSDLLLKKIEKFKNDKNYFEKRIENMYSTYKKLVFINE